MGGSLAERFETQPNALNLLRLLLASTVIVWHATSLGPHDTTLYAPIAQLLGNLPVDAFFAISGFLIARSWLQHPQVGRFLLARATRILPGLWACLAVTAFVIAPVAAVASGTSFPTLAGQLHFVVDNMATYISQFSIAGSANDLIYAGSWNGSLWTLWWESICYLVLAGFAMAGGLRVRPVLLLTSLFWLLQLAATTGDAAGFRPARLGLMFATGTLLYLLRDRVPVRADLAGLSVLLIAGASFTPCYRLLAAPAVAYLCLWAALALGRHRRLVLRNDLSYGVYVYGWPAQQLLVMVGLAGSWAAFSLVSLAVTLPLAAASWFVVERPAMRLRRRLTSRSRARPAPSPAVTAAAATPA